MEATSTLLDALFNSGLLFGNQNTIAFYFCLFAPIHFYGRVEQKKSGASQNYIELLRFESKSHETFISAS